MAFKMTGYSAGEGTGSMAKQKVSYQGPITEEVQKRLDAGESKFEIFDEKDEAAWYEEQYGNELDGDAKKKSRKKSDAMFNEAYIVRDRKS